MKNKTKSNSQTLLQKIYPKYKSVIASIITVIFIILFIGAVLFFQTQLFPGNAQINYPLMILRGHKDIITKIAITPDEKTLISGSDDQTIKIWDLTTGKLKNTLDNQSEVKTLALFSDGKTFLSGSQDKKIKFWHLDSQTSQVIFENDYPIHTLAISSNDEIIAFDSFDRIKLLMDKNNYQFKKTLLPNNSEISTLAITTDNQMLISGTLDGQIQKFNLITGQKINNSLTISKAIKAGIYLVIDRNNINFFASSCTSTIHQYNLKKFQENENQGLINNDNICLIDVNNKNILAGSTINGKVHLWNFAKLQFIATLSADENQIHHITFSQSGKILAVASGDHSIKVWNLENLGIL